MCGIARFCDFNKKQDRNTLIKMIELSTGGFTDLMKVREWVLIFVRWYNLEHRHKEALNSSRQISVIEGEMKQAKANKPERWSGQTRGWSRSIVVMLNPDNTDEQMGNDGVFLAQ